MGTIQATVIFVIFVVVVYVRAYRLLKRESLSDMPV